MNKTLEFSVTIQAPRALVWKTMLEPAGYEAWTAAFTEGSCFSGSWDQGQPIRFLAPNGDGMVAVIEENRPLELISIRHLGQIKDGVEDTTSPEVKAWAPAYEKFAFTDAPNGTQVKVSLDTVPAYESYMLETYPKALQLLKSLCETKAGES